MKILLSWLNEFIPLPAQVRQVANDLTMLGLTVDSVTEAEGETVLELDVTTNRPDCLSHFGVARELAALYGKQLPPFGGNKPVEPGSGLQDNSPETVLRGRPQARIRRARLKDSPVEIVATDVCRRYSARLIRGVRVGPSPSWLARRLELVGIRSINNVADATNYILMAYGHPLHAFDLDRLEGRRIIVRRAASNESLTTLDGVERQLAEQDLVIADARRPVALAGVMGGQETEISPHTENVLLESAWFEPVSVRRTAKRHGLHTEASHRFERGADIEATLAAANQCIGLIQELAGGTVDPREIDAHARWEPRKPILLRRRELARHLGLEPPAQDVERILFRLGFSPEPAGAIGWKATPPTHRIDVTREIDLVEEIARHFGYDRFPARLPAAESGEPARKASQALKEDPVRALCLGLGYDETISLVLVGRRSEFFAERPGELASVTLANPLSEEAAMMRTSLVPGLLSAVQWNLNRGSETVRLFELGNIYRRQEDGYREPPMLALVATGDRVEAGLRQPPKPYDFLDLKGDVEQLVELFEIPSRALDSEDWPDSFHRSYRPGHRARLLTEGKVLALLGELHPHIAESWKFRQPVFVAELFLEVLYARNLRSPRFQAISRYPAVQRDFSILLPEAMRYEEVRAAITGLGIPELVAVTPVEIFRGAAGGPVPPGKFSLLLRVTLQSHQGTLTEAELTKHGGRIIDCLERRLGAQIRM